MDLLPAYSAAKSCEADFLSQGDCQERFARSTETGSLWNLHKKTVTAGNTVKRFVAE